MGQSSSMPVSTRKKPVRRSFRSPFPRRSVVNQGSLSATFNYVDSELKVNQLNVNLATEEELMTLPGVTRAVARNIVEYRQAIGRFNKVEDLALVSGIGADRLDEIRPEICVNKRKNQSCASSRAQSLDSVSSGGAEVSPPPHHSSRPPLDVNTATVFQLMTVRGINQELAAAIVEYRDRRGDFFSLDDLLKVKGLNQMKLSALRPKLTVKSDLKYDTKKFNSPVEQRSPSNISRNNNYCNGVAVKDVYELVSAYCQRPTYRDVELNKNCVKIATWNLTQMCKDKAENAAVREVFCLTVLENKLSCIVIQGLEDASALQLLSEEFKTPICKRVVEWKGSRGDWKSEFVPIQRHNGCFNLGFMYNAQVVNVSSVKLVQDNSMIRAAMANLEFDGTCFSLLNVHMASVSSESSLNTLVTSLKPSIVMGDFTVIKNLDKSTLSCYKEVLPTGTSTKCLPKPGVFYYDNIYIRDTALFKYSGCYGVVRSGLCHLAIPRGWNWNGPVSEHCPVWTQLSS